MDLETVAARFHENFKLFGELGASVSVWRRGVEVLSPARGWRDRP